MTDTITSARVRELGATRNSEPWPATTHSIKCWPEPFGEMLAGRKTAEFRLNDRNYQVGDRLLIREWCPDEQAYTHREIERLITHVLADSFGMPKGYAMLSLADLPALDRIAKALDLLERVEAQDAGLVEAMGRALVEADSQGYFFSDLFWPGTTPNDFTRDYEAKHGKPRFGWELGSTRHGAVLVMIRAALAALVGGK